MIALVGNMNNGMFSLMRHLRDSGLDANLLFVKGFDHFHPKADTFDLVDLEHCHEVSWLRNGFRSPDVTQIRKDLDGADTVLATGDEAAAAAVAGVPIDIYFPYGDDIAKWSHPSHFRSARQAAVELRYLSYRTMRRPIASHHRGVRRAICSARHVIVDRMNPMVDELMMSLPIQGQIHRSPWPFLHPASYREAFASGRPPDVHWRSAVDGIRADHEFLVLYHGRHSWTRPGIDAKNTNHLILGFAEFVRRHPAVKACLVTLEYGKDVEASKALIAELGLQNRVRWLPLLFRKDLMYIISQADLCCGEFAESYLTFGTILEALSLGKPLVHHRDDRLYEGPLYPVLNAREPDGITEALEVCLAEPERCRQMGLEGQAWLDEHVVRRPLELIGRLIGSRQRFVAEPEAATVPSGATS